MSTLVDRFTATTLEGEEKGGPIQSSHLGNKVFMPELRLATNCFVKLDFLHVKIIHPCQSFEVILGLEPIAINLDKDTTGWDLAPLGFAGIRHRE